MDDRDAPGRHSPIQLSLIAGASVQVISAHYTHLTKNDAYEAMLRVLTRRRVEERPGR